MEDLELLTIQKDRMAAEYWRVVVGTYTRIFGHLYNRAKKWHFEKRSASFSGHQVVKRLRFLAQWQILLISRAVQSPFLKILIFRHVAAIFGANFSQNSEKRAKFSPKRVKKAPKSKFSKIGSVLPSIFIRSSQKLKKNQFGVTSGSGNLPWWDF